MCIHAFGDYSKDLKRMGQRVTVPARAVQWIAWKSRRTNVKPEAISARFAKHPDSVLNWLEVLLNLELIDGNNQVGYRATRKLTTILKAAGLNGPIPTNHPKEARKQGKRKQQDNRPERQPKPVGDTTAADILKY